MQEARTAPQLPPSPWSKARRTPQWFPFSATIAAGSQIVFSAKFVPEWWLVALIAAAGVRVNVYGGPAAAGQGLPLGGGGNLKLPGDWEALSVSNVGENPATVVAIAITGLSDLTYDPGDLA
jgi:hypothetical protein